MFLTSIPSGLLLLYTFPFFFPFCKRIKFFILLSSKLRAARAASFSSFSKLSPPKVLALRMVLRWIPARKWLWPCHHSSSLFSRFTTFVEVSLLVAPAWRWSLLFNSHGIGPHLNYEMATPLMLKFSARRPGQWSHMPCQYACHTGCSPSGTCLLGFLDKYFFTMYFLRSTSRMSISINL